MKTLSIQQPWAWAIFTPEAGKDIENRDWPTQVRGRIRIHTGKKIDSEGILFLRAQGYDVPANLPTGCILGEVTLTGCVRASDASSPWAFGAYCFTLVDPVAYETPIPARGMLGFFETEASPCNP